MSSSVILAIDPKAHDIVHQRHDGMPYHFGILSIEI